MPAYATITASVDGPFSSAAIKVVLRATPVVPDHLLEYPAEPVRISVGRVQASADDDGMIRLRIPLDTDPAAPWWEFELRLNPRWGRTLVVPLGTYQVTESSTLAKLMNPDIPEPTDPGEVTDFYPGADVYPSDSFYPMGA